jgi:fructose-1,6-bisphosphatase
MTAVNAARKGNLKMTKEHYDTLAYAVRQQFLNNPERWLPRIDTLSTNSDITRFNWDLLWASSISGYPTVEAWVANVLHTYLNDDHIDSALRIAVRSTVNLPSKA